MKRSSITIILFASLFVFCSSGTIVAQSTHSSDWTLSMLRGSWRFHTFEEKWTLVFESDHNLIIDRNDARYTLLPGSIRTFMGNDSTEYPYRLNGSKLTLQLPDGSERTYSKTGDGEAEHNVKGMLYAEIDSTGRKAHLSFDGKHTFNLTDEVGEDIGVYRVVDNTIVLALDDSTLYTTEIRSRNDDGHLEEVAFDRRLYATEKPAIPSTAGTYIESSSTSTNETHSEGSSGSFFELLARLFFPGSSSSQPETDRSADQTSTSSAATTPAASTSAQPQKAPASAPVRKFGSKRPNN